MLNENFKDMLNALNDAGVDYMLVGAYAMAAHGCPRATGDIDFWVRPATENAHRLWSALKSFGAPVSKISIADLCETDVVYQIGLPPQRIDFLTSVSGLTFDTAWPSRIIVEVDGIAVTVIGLNELRSNKKATGREKDIADLALLSRLIQ